MNIAELREDIIREEGFVSHVYSDHLGFQTLGVGRLVDKRKGGGITIEEAHYLLENDIFRVLEGLRRTIDFWDSLSDSQQRALCNMGFQMGVGGVLKFKRMLAAIKVKDAVHIEREARDSNWWRDEKTRGRAERVIQCLLDF